MTPRFRVERPSFRAAAVFGAAIVLCWCAAAIPARADMPGDTKDNFRISIGGMAADAFTEGSLSTQGGIGATVNFEDIFDLPVSKKVGRLSGFWHYMDRQFLDFGYVNIDRSGERVIQQDVEWGDFIFKTGADMTAGFKTQFPYLAWRYSFLNLPQVRISGSAGLVYLGLSASLEGTGNVTDASGQNPQTGTFEQQVSVAYPVPLLGLQIDWALNKRLMLEMYKRLIAVDFAGIRGGIDESAIRLHWFMTKNFGIAGGLDKESIDLKEYDSGDAKARFRYEVSGFSFYLDFAF